MARYPKAILIYAFCRKQVNIATSKCSRVGRSGNPGTPPPPKSVKIGIANWWYIPWVYCFGEDAEIPELVRK